MSGIEVNSNDLAPIIQRINNHSKQGTPLRYAVFRINDELTQVVADGEGGRDKTWADLQEDLKNRKPCYAVFDLEYHNKKNGIDTNKLIVVLWRGNASPGTAGVKERMLISSTLKTFQQNLAIQGGVFQAGTESELEHEEVIEFANRI